MPSLITTVRSKFLDAIRSVNPPGRWKILVVDEHSQKLLSSVLKQFDILEENVTLIESISSHRDPQPGFEAIYLLMPTTQNVERIIKDFTGPEKQYAGAHLFFLDGLADPLFERLTSSPAEPHLKGLQDLYINFWPVESQTFSLKDPGMFFSLFSPPRSESTARAARDRLEEDLRFMAKRITNVCITLNENPYIRYYKPSHHSPLGPLKPTAATRNAPPPSDSSSRWRTNLARGAESRAWEAADNDFASRLLAMNVQQYLDEHKKQNPDFGKDPIRTRGILIITDRSMDIMAPFLHEFTYQAMANDLLPIEDGKKYRYKFQSANGVFEDKEAIISDADNVWTEVRHMHVREAIDKLIAEFTKFCQENAGFKQNEGVANLDDMKDLLANLPQYQEQREKFSLHLNMAESCMNTFESDKLALLVGIEQNCATGLTAEGKTPKTLVEEMVPVLDSREIVNLNKVRIVALYIQHRQGVPDEDRRRLYQHARLSMAEQDAVNALIHLGVRITRGPSDRDVKKTVKSKNNTDDEYELSRFRPILTTVLEDQAVDRLDPSTFPYLKDKPGAVGATYTPGKRTMPVAAQPTSLRSTKPTWHKGARGAQSASDNRQRILVFVAGGMTYSEIREAYQLSTKLNKEILIGSTHTFTPVQFMNDMKSLESGGLGSMHLPNGLQEPRSGQRPFQDYYDKRYFTPDPVPTAPPAGRRPGIASLAPPAQDRSRLGKPSPAPSYNGSTISTSSANSTGEKDEKKKKKGLFRF